MNATHQRLVKRLVAEVQTLPENLVQEVLDFVGYLRTKYDKNGEEDRRQALLATFGSWKDDRTPEEIIQDIYATRTISEGEPGL